jgi:hypothetical protein|tara:strand:- start:27 stop:230 length:204 start_codon:yes stop_codon:yes gene_type:complete
VASSLFTQAGLDALEENIAAGHLEVEYDNKRVRYRTLSEMMQIRDLIKRRLGGKTTRRVVQYSNGIK